LRDFFYLADSAFQASIVGQPELVQQDRFAAAARAFVRERPAYALRLAAARLLAFVWFSPNVGAEYGAQLGAIYRFLYMGLLALGLVGLTTWRPVTAQSTASAAPSASAAPTASPAPAATPSRASSPTSQPISTPTSAPAQR
jgi:hypothetical protein